jgi:UDP-N-acetylglucosamine--N-acetylmuramyl-(pentapeptide) pyrophosphoryl-undecaprenol N-acetylglucosamine transferase
MNVIIAAGGTGGHIFPGIALAKEFVRRTGDAQIRFVGTERGLEKKLVPNAGFPLTFIPSGALKNVSPGRRIASLAKMPAGFLAAARLLNQFRPDVVIGVGGYASGVMTLTAALCGAPTLAVELNAMPGFTNRILAPFVRAAAITYREAAAHFPGKSALTGTPVRAEFERLPARTRTIFENILVFGGSQGAHAINQAMIEAAKRFGEIGVNIRVMHQTGEKDFEAVQAAYAAAGVRAEVRPFINDMAAAFADADLLICRAGAATAAEIAAAGKAAIFIPFPQASDDHQRKNAEAFVRAGAGKMILQADATGARLAQEIQSLLAAPAEIARMEAASRSLAVPNAAQKTVDLALKLVRNEPISELLIAG